MVPAWTTHRYRDHVPTPNRHDLLYWETGGRSPSRPFSSPHVSWLSDKAYQNRCSTLGFGLGWAEPGGPTGRTYSVSESSKSDTAGTTLSTGAHAGLTQVRPRCMTACTYLGNNPHQRGWGSASVVDSVQRQGEQQELATKNSHSHIRGPALSV